MTEKAPIAIQMNVSREVAGTQFSYITTYPQEISLDDLKAVNNKIMAAMEHQEIWARISAINTEIETHTRQLAQVRFAKENITARYPDGKMPGEMRTHITQNNDNITRLETLIKTLSDEQHRLWGALA